MLLRESDLFILKLRFSKFNKFVSTPIFGELQLNADIIWFSNLLQLKNQSSVAFHLLWFWKEIWRFKVKEYVLFVEQKYKNGTESKMENPTLSFGKMNYALQLIKELQIKSKTVMSWSSWRRKECIFCNVSFVRRKFFNICVPSQCRV